MSSSTISALIFATRQVSIYLGTAVLVAGVLGGLFNIIVFLSLRTFRQTSCAFYLVVMSFVNIGSLMTTTLSRIMISGFGIDWTQSSLIYCKFRLAFVQLCALTSLTCMCLATLDQFFATCSSLRWRQWSSSKLTYRLTAITVLFWTFHGVPYVLYYGHFQSPTTGQVSCIITNLMFQNYYTYGYSLMLMYFLPTVLTIVFALMAYCNVQTIPYRTVPLVRRELDKQLTEMILVQVVYNFITMTPFAVVTIIGATTNVTNNSVLQAQMQFASILGFFVYYLYWASSFYIYICVSERFRQQFIYVIFDVHMKRFQKVKIPAINRILPQA
ncbi:unnamed protein product [Adineta steineri]|uniref:G-protein coupled receptors family 1 profile domain-containing protein n=1 Tax=Adineta steineri TaxID=433720 RepID=A0A819B7Y7_9BILA|nr:unnamed protein product [Adineta steineri]